MRKLNRKRYLAALISAIMLLALLPITSLAASADYGDFLVTGDDLSGVSFENDTLTISTSGTYTVAMAQKGNVTDQHITVASGVTAALVLDGVSVSSGTTALEISGADVTLILSSGSDNSFVSKGAACSAIHAPSGSTLTITSVTKTAALLRHSMIQIQGDRLRLAEILPRTLAVFPFRAAS